jgi:hypothetical protein
MVAKAHEIIAWLPIIAVMSARMNVGQNKEPTRGHQVNFVTKS